jgi:RsiW-degrading membrane proteinase PrsW (M82 family)
MDIGILFSAALLPAFLLLLYICKKDPHPEPTGKLVKAFQFGVMICIPVSFVETVIESVLFGGEEPTTLFGTTVMAFFVAAIPEETAKLIALWLVLRKNPYFDEHFDGIVYAVCVSLGFAAIENVFYIVGEESWMSVAFSRALLSVPGHYAFGVLMGYYYSMYHFVNRSSNNAVCILLMPVLAHGIYDALAMSGMADPMVGAVCLASAEGCAAGHAALHRNAGVQHSG